MDRRRLDKKRKGGRTRRAKLEWVEPISLFVYVRSEVHVGRIGLDENGTGGENDGSMMLCILYVWVGRNRKQGEGGRNYGRLMGGSEEGLKGVEGQKVQVVARHVQAPDLQ